MKSLVLFAHLIFVGIWLGCVLTEAIFERALLGKGNEAQLVLARLHVKVDLLVEIPAFFIVFLTGAYMLTFQTLSILIMIKIAFGFVAILANMYCVYIVFKRREYAEAGSWEKFIEVDNVQHKVGAVVLSGILGALLVGSYA